MTPSTTALGLTGRVAIVTGGSRGIGRAVVELLGSCGAHVVVNYLRDENAAAATVNLARSYDVKAVAIQANVAQLDEAERLVQETVEHFGRVDFLICNAGIWTGAPVESLSEEVWNKTLDINLKGTWSVCRAVVPFMKQQKFGRIVVVSSTAGQRGEAHVSNYAASKGALLGVIKTIARGYAADGILCFGVAPGFTVSEMTEEYLRGRGGAKIIADIPLGRVSSTDEVAEAIRWLATEAPPATTGSVIDVNGASYVR